MVINTSTSVVSAPSGLQRRSVAQEQNSTQVSSKKAESSSIDLRSTIEAQNSKAVSDRIQNVDVAIEYTNLVKYQLELESEVATSSQANILPDRVLKLLGDSYR